MGRIRGVLTACIALGLTAVAAPAAHADVVLNEISCDGSDWIEVLNTGDAAENVSGWALSDAPLPSGYTFPDPTVVPAGEELAAEEAAS